MTISLNKHLKYKIAHFLVRAAALYLVYTMFLVFFYISTYYYDFIEYKNFSTIRI